MVPQKGESVIAHVDDFSLTQLGYAGRLARLCMANIHYAKMLNLTDAGERALIHHMGVGSAQEGDE